MKAFPFENMKFNLHILKTFKKKVYINYTKKSMWNRLDLKYLKRISHGQGVLLLLISKRILFDFLNSNICWCHFGGKKIQFQMWQLKCENIKRFFICLKAFFTWDYHPKEWFIEPTSTLFKLNMMCCHR
jgi:hypothetical protein